jgi:zinc-finger of transposase IS204/IS1001/IS1096/IS1165
LLPHLDALSIERIEHSGDALWMSASVRARTATCRFCGIASGRVYGRYSRELRDVSVAGATAKIRLQVRRFICVNAACTVRTFVEQVDGVTRRRLRTTGLAAAMSAHGLAVHEEFVLSDLLGDLEYR